MDAALALHLRSIGDDPVTGIVAMPEALPRNIIHGCQQCTLFLKGGSRLGAAGLVRAANRLLNGARLITSSSSCRPSSSACLSC